MLVARFYPLPLCLAFYLYTPHLLTFVLPRSPLLHYPYHTDHYCVTVQLIVVLTLPAHLPHVCCSRYLQRTVDYVPITGGRYHTARPDFGYVPFPDGIYGRTTPRLVVLPRYVVPHRRLRPFDPFTNVVTTVVPDGFNGCDGGYPYLPALRAVDHFTFTL